jgi:hypothetical protein
MDVVLRRKGIYVVAHQVEVSEHFLVCGLVDSDAGIPTLLENCGWGLQGI